MTLAQKLSDSIRDVSDFPKPGILFKDITPILSDPELSISVSQAFFDTWRDEKIEGIVGIESRGFIFGMQLAQQLKVPFIPVRKAGKLPYNTVKHSYDLEYGSAEMEIHVDAIQPGQRILIHDDLLATGGTAAAAAELVQKLEGQLAGFSFLVELTFLKGSQALATYNQKVQSLVSF